MKKLFLSSSLSDTYQHLEDFIGQPLQNKSVTFIPTASVVEEYKDYVKNDRNAFQLLGIKVVDLDVSQYLKEDIAQIIRSNDFIYISGGNTFYLLQELRSSGADQVLLEAIQAGKPYIGASAGSIVMAKNIEYVSKMDDKSKAKTLTDYSGLGLFDSYIVPHKGNNPFKDDVEQIIKEYKGKLPIIPISNNQVVQVKGSSVEVLGI